MDKERTAAAQAMDADDFAGVSYLLCGDTVKIVVQLDCAYFGARLTVGSQVFADAFNDCEPYDHLTHVFYVPQTLLTPQMTLTFTALDSTVEEALMPQLGDRPLVIRTRLAVEEICVYIHENCGADTPVDIMISANRQNTIITCRSPGKLGLMDIFAVHNWVSA